jgi:hypothetical protein
MQNRYFDRPLPAIAASGFVETGCGARWYYARFDQMVEQFVQDRVAPKKHRPFFNSVASSRIWDVICSSASAENCNINSTVRLRDRFVYRWDQVATACRWAISFFIRDSTA